MLNRICEIDLAKLFTGFTTELHQKVLTNLEKIIQITPIDQFEYLNYGLILKIGPTHPKRASMSCDILTVSAQALSQLNSEAELVFLLAHEIGHYLVLSQLYGIDGFEAELEADKMAANDSLQQITKEDQKSWNYFKGNLLHENAWQDISSFSVVRYPR